MARAAFQYMYSAEGKTYLDCINNICHVGHCHPVVVEAGQRQMRTLNTNTRFLYDSLNEYAAMLADLFPDPLDTVYFLNSGSEAGDLSQRIARTITGSNQTLVLDHGYHGNTIAGIQASPSKFNGPGGSGPVDFVHPLDIPDSYRGKYADNADQVDLYGQDLDEQLDSIEERGLKPGIFYAESIVGVGGQVTFPDGYLAMVYDKIRSRGGLCIADEVQVGFGRVGDRFWGFQLQEVIPDLVVLGKPMGNGHPLAAVVTTRSIAQEFSNGMEFFSSFGGNPVSCEIGKAVLNVIMEENLQHHAREIGNYLKSELVNLQSVHPEIGDVRGRGLFLGVELVSNPETREPLTMSTSKLIENLKDNGILMSSDGPFRNVLKIKPPLPFNRKNADTLVAQLDSALKGL